MYNSVQAVTTRLTYDLLNIPHKIQDLDMATMLR